MPDIGHNSAEILNQAAQNTLRSLIERIERENQNKAEVMADLKEIYAEAKATGFSVPILRKVIRLRAADKGKLAEEQAILDLYMHAAGDAK